MTLGENVTIGCGRHDSFSYHSTHWRPDVSNESVTSAYESVPLPRLERIQPSSTVFVDD